MSLQACLLIALAIPSMGIDQEHTSRIYQPPATPPGWSEKQLRQFMRELTDFVYKNHVVRDENRKTYGMTYEFYRDNKWVQVFGLDSMHDGAWFMSAMITAHRIDPQGDYLDKVQSYQVPFYVNMLENSNRLFPGMEPTNEDKKPFQHPVKGWVPRGWDDGAGYDKNTWEPFEDSYFTSSNHLMQDVADALLNVWMTTQDPRVAQAIMHIHNYKREFFGVIPVIDFAAGVTNFTSELYEAHRLPVFSTSAMNPYYTGMYEQKGHSLSSYDDNLAWEYRAATARYMLQGELPEEFALYALAKVYSHMMGMEMFFDGVLTYPYGMYFFDIQGQPSFIEGQGKLDGYASNAEKLLGARGIQISWVGAAILPILANQPDLWERLYRDNHSDETLIRVVDNPPVTDGRRDEVYSKSQSIDTNGAHISLLSDPRNLHIFIESGKPKVVIQIQHTGPVVGETRMGKILVTREGEVSATNDKGEKLVHAASFSSGERWTAELRLPYTVVPEQSQWINGVEHGRYTVTIGNDEQQVVYLLSEPERIIRRLEEMVLGAIDNWHKVWQDLGCIPSGYRGPRLRVESWELSDVGNYAHLIKTIALWLTYKAGTSEWELIRSQLSEEPLLAQPLPNTVLRLQSLE